MRILHFAMTAFVLLSAGFPIWAEELRAYRRPLFDGTSLNGWTIEHEAEVDVVDGCLRLKAGHGWVRSDHRLRDFELHLEWKALKATDYDAGIFIRSSLAGKPFPELGDQVNLLEGKEGSIPTLMGAESRGLVKPTGEWNVFDLRVVGESAELKINGQPAWNASGLKQLDGWLGFQVEVPNGGQFLFRHIEVTEIGYQALFNGRDLTGWEGVGGAADDCWSVIDGILTCSGKKRALASIGQRIRRFQFSTRLSRFQRGK